MNMNATFDAIYIATYNPHVYLMKILCQSIRYFCASIPIVVIKDGNFELSELKKSIGVEEFDDRQLPLRLRHLQGLQTKFKALFNVEYPRYLFLDADIVLISDPNNVPINGYDFYVDGGFEDVSNLETKRRISKLIFDVDRLREFDPDFDFSDLLTFNTGQYFATTGMVDPSLLIHCVKYSESYSKIPIFKYGDQGVMNYIINKMRHNDNASVGASKFAIFPSKELEQDFPELTQDSVRRREYNKHILVHYTGPTRKWGFQHTSYKWLPQFFQNEYYRSLPVGTKQQDRFWQHAQYWQTRIQRKLRSILTNLGVNNRTFL